MTKGRFAVWSQVPTEVRLLGNWEIGMLFSLMIIFQSEGSGPFQREIPGL